MFRLNGMLGIFALLKLEFMKIEVRDHNKGRCGCMFISHSLLANIDVTCSVVKFWLATDLNLLVTSIFY